MENIQKYLAAVENLARLKSPICFRNSNPQHAAIVMSTIIKTSEKEVRIYDNDLHGDLTDIYPELLNSVESFIRQGKVFKIVLKDITKSESKIYQLLCDFSKSQVQNLHVKKASPEFIALLQKDLNGSFYFMVGDDRAVRIQDTADERKAYCCFSDPKIAPHFMNTFDLHFSECKNVFC